MAWYHTYQLFLQYIAFTGAACGSVGLFLIWLTRTDFAAIRRIPPPLRCVFALALIFAAFAAQKQSVRDSLFSASSSSSSPASLSSVTQDEDDGSNEEQPDDYGATIIEDEDQEYQEGDDDCDDEVECIRATAIRNNRDSVSIGLAWSEIMEIENWDVLISAYAEVNGPEVLEVKINPPAGSTNHVATLTAENFPSNSIPHKCFFRIKAIKDTDHDGLSDERERLWGTDPNDPDSDGDGYMDGYEIVNGTNPRLEEIDQRTYEEIDGTYYSVTGSFTRVDFDYDATLQDDEDGVPIDSPGGDGAVQPDGITDFSMEPTWSAPFAYQLSGVKFRPSVSGYYCFQIAADDYATLKVGEVTAKADWHEGRNGIGDEAIGYFVAGLDYNVKVFHRNDGGPTFLRCLKFGQLLGLCPTLSNTVDNNVVIFEQPYLSMPKRIIVTNSTFTVSRILASSGVRGGTLKIRTHNMDKLKCIEGTNIDDRDYELPPNTNFALIGAYQGIGQSQQQDDVKISTVFEENGSGLVLSNEVQVTVFEVFVRSKFDSQTINNQRHKLGPLEDLSFEVSPFLGNNRWEGWTVVLGEEGDDGYKEHSYVSNLVDDSFEYDIKMYWRTIRDKVRFSTLGQSLDIPYRVVAPSKVIRHGDIAGASLEDWRKVTNNPTFMPQELFCGFTVGLRVLPEYVLLENIFIAEGICPAENASGSLANLGPHDASRGAYRSFAVNYVNRVVGRDFVGYHNLHKVDGSWKGSANWNIPMMWKTNVESTNDWSDAVCFTTNAQEFTCTKDGTLYIKKFGKRGFRKVRGEP